MNILDKLRRQSSADTFEVTITKRDAVALIKFFPNSNIEKGKEFLPSHIEMFDNGFNSLHESRLRMYPLEIDYQNQIALTQYTVIAAFAASTMDRFTMWVSFVKQTIKTDTD